MKALELKIPPVALVLLTATAMWALARLVPGGGLAFAAGPWLAAALAVAGLATAVLGVQAFRRAQTTVDPRVPGKAAQLVTSGIFQRTRNPMYVGLVAILLAWAVYLAHGAALALVPVFVVYMSRFQIQPEERVMREKFGADYESYTQAVRRWL